MILISIAMLSNLALSMVISIKYILDFERYTLACIERSEDEVSNLCGVYEKWLGR